jgi:hypothetical protein
VRGRPLFDKTFAECKRTRPGERSKRRSTWPDGIVDVLDWLTDASLKVSRLWQA